MDRSQNGWTDKIKNFFNPPTQNERIKRHQQLKDTAFFVGSSAVLLIFRKQILQAVQGMNSA